MSDSLEFLHPYLRQDVKFLDEKSSIFFNGMKIASAPVSKILELTVPGIAFDLFSIIAGRAAAFMLGDIKDGERSDFDIEKMSKSAQWVRGRYICTLAGTGAASGVLASTPLIAQAIATDLVVSYILQVRGILLIKRRFGLALDIPDAARIMNVAMASTPEDKRTYALNGQSHRDTQGDTTRDFASKKLAPKIGPKLVDKAMEHEAMAKLKAIGGQSIGKAIDKATDLTLDQSSKNLLTKSFETYLGKGSQFGRFVPVIGPLTSAGLSALSTNRSMRAAFHLSRMEAICKHHNIKCDENFIQRIRDKNYSNLFN